MLKKIISAFLLTGFLLTCNAQTELSKEIDKNIELRIENGVNTGIVVGIIDANGTTYFYSYGLKSMKTNEPIDKNSIFEIGSISKAFTGILLADMVLKDKMKLYDPLQKYLPEGITAPTRNDESIKLINMANHTSSLPRMPSNFSPANPENPFVDYSEKQLYDFLQNYELPRDIGSKYEYSNYAMGLLGHILALQNNTTYEALLAKKITEPLGLENTGISLSANMKSNLAIGYSGGAEVENWDLTTLAGAGAIRSNAVDMLKFLAFNMGIKKNDLYPAMQLSHKNSRKEGDEPIVGLGWHTMVFDDIEIVWHNGGTGGYRTFSGFIKGGDKGVVVLSNSNVGVDDIGIHILHPESPLNKIKPSIATKIQGVIDEEGLEAGSNTYSDLKKDKADEFDFGENELNRLGHKYLNNQEVEKALGVFKLNVGAYPKSSNVYGNYASALMKNGDKEGAIENFKKSVELNPANPKAIERLKELGVDIADVIKEIKVDEAILETYVGKYELAPGFILTVTREGSQLITQATGQQKLPVFPKSENEFYLKVVDAQLTFNKNNEGTVESLTLHQNGQNMPGKKLSGQADETDPIFPEIEVDEKILETYVGKYELAPNFILTVSRDGTQLKAQVTGQPEFPVFPKSENEFYFKVVEAQLTFNKNDEGTVESVTLHQNGQNMPGKKLVE